MEVELKPRIVVFGVGGAGGNAVNNMIESNLQGVEFVVANTDAQALARSQAKQKVQLGLETTEGLGAGARPDVGAAAAEESLDDIKKLLKESHMCFIAAGMGGGTGTGAAPVIAREAAALDVLTVGVVTKPFDFEGRRRHSIAEDGIEHLRKQVDTLVIIPNQNLFRVANANTTFADAFGMADRVLYSAVRGITDLMVMPGLINLDFADVRTVMAEMGSAMMGTGEGEGENRAVKAAQAAIANPLLDDVSMKGARGVLINITGGADMTLFEVDEAANEIRSEVDANAQIILGSTFDQQMEGIIRVSVVATGIEDGNETVVSAARQQLATEYAGAGEHSSKTAARTTERSRTSERNRAEIRTPIITARTSVELDPEQEAPEMLPLHENSTKERSGDKSNLSSLFGWRKPNVSPRQRSKPSEELFPDDEELEIPAFLRRS